MAVSRPEPTPALAAQLRDSLEMFAREPAVGRDQIRKLVSSNPRMFLSAALPVLKSSADSPTARYLLSVLQMNGVLPACDPTLLSLEDDIALTSRIKEEDPLLDLKLARRFSEAAWEGSTDVEHKVAVRILEVLDHLGDVRRLNSMFGELLTHPNPHLRSKGALLMARSASAEMVDKLLADADSRVRANAVEALWGVDTEAARRQLERATADSDHRAVGNALYGLHMLGETSAIRRLIEMTAHESPSFRATAAWVMGETGSPRFVPELGRLIRDPDANVRRNVLRALARVRQAVAASKTAAHLAVHICQVVPQKDGTCVVHAGVSTDQGGEIPGLSPTHFHLRHCGTQICDYRVQKKEQQGSLALGMILPAPRGSRQLQDEPEAGVEACLKLKRKLDRWVFLRYTGKGIQVGDSGNLSNVLGLSELLRRAKNFLSSDPEVLARVVRSTQTLFPGLLESVRLALEVLTSLTGDRKLMLVQDVVADASWDETDAKEWAEAAQSCTACATEVNAIVLPDAPPPLVEILTQLCARSGGTFLRADNPEHSQVLCEKLYSNLVQGYEIAYQPSAAAMDGPQEVQLQIACTGGFGEDTLPLQPAQR